ncbi:MAG: putative transcriptional regulator [Pseudohongiellaceae bacterium]|jgi:putative transcriptional regulator
MPIVVNLDLVLAKQQMKGKAVAELVGISQQNFSLLRTGKVKGVRLSTLEKLCGVLECQPGDILEYQSD